MRAKTLLLALLIPCAAWGDGMVGVPDAKSERSAATQPGARRHIVIDGGGTPNARLVEHEAWLARERAEEEARRRIREQEMTAALAYTRGSADQAARDARSAAEIAAWRRQQELEMAAAGNAAFACYYYDPNTGCRGLATGK